MISLNLFNLFLFGLHLIAAIALAIWFATRTTNYLNVGTTLTTKTTTTDCSTDPCTLSFVLDNKNEFYATRLTIAFFAITACAHLFYYFNIKDLYGRALRQGNNYFRWIEYAITATMMILIIANQAGISDQSTLGLLGVNTVITMFVGQLVELNLRTEQNKTNVIALTVFGWALMFFNFVFILYSFGVQVSDFNAANCFQDVARTIRAKVPDFVWAIVLTQLFFFASFGVWQLVHIYLVFNKVRFDYVFIEKGYLWLSLISKFLLGALLGYGAFASSEGRGSVFYC